MSKFEQIKPAIVSILSEDDVISGTGFFITSDGYILTCYHVIEPVKNKDGMVKIRKSDGSKLTAKVHEDKSKYEDEIDFAILQANVEDADCLPLGTLFSEGDEWIAIGYGLPNDYNEVHNEGDIYQKITRKGQPGYDLKLNAKITIRGGFSGSPVLDIQTGKVVGIMKSEIEGKEGFAQPMEDIWNLWHEIEKYNSNSKKIIDIRLKKPGDIQRTNWKYQVVAFDIDGTLIKGENFLYSWRNLWNHLELSDETNRQAMMQYLNSEKNYADYEKWFNFCLSQFMMKNLKRDDFKDIAKNLHITNNFISTIRTLKNEHFTLAIISGSIDTLLETMIPDYKELFDYICMNKFQFDQYGRLTGGIPTKFDFKGKAEALKLICQNVGCSTKEAVFIGEGFNDKDIMNEAGLGIAYPPTVPDYEFLKNVIPIREDDLDKILEHILVIK
jgi:HAD superfamily phosphoserine phosphatase-like hydrolase